MKYCNLARLFGAVWCHISMTSLQKFRIYAALLVALLRPVRWVINLILTAQEAAATWQNEARSERHGFLGIPVDDSEIRDQLTS